MFGYGERMHVVSTEQHWNDLKGADIAHLSLHRWVKSVNLERGYRVRTSILTRSSLFNLNIHS